MWHVINLFIKLWHFTIIVKCRHGIFKVIVILFIHPGTMECTCIKVNMYHTFYLERFIRLEYVYFIRLRAVIFRNFTGANNRVHLITLSKGLDYDKIHFIQTSKKCYAMYNNISYNFLLTNKLMRLKSDCDFCDKIMTEVYKNMFWKRKMIMLYIIEKKKYGIIAKETNLYHISYRCKLPRIRTNVHVKWFSAYAICLQIKIITDLRNKLSFTRKFYCF